MVHDDYVEYFTHLGGVYFTPEDDSLMLDSLSFLMSLSPLEGGVTLGSSLLDGKSGNTSEHAFGTWSAALPDESKMFLYILNVNV